MSDSPRFSHDFITKNTRRLALLQLPFRTPSEEGELTALIVWVTAEVDRCRPLPAATRERLGLKG